MSVRRFFVPTLALVALIAAPAAAQSLPSPQAPLGLGVSLPAAKRLAGSREFIAAGDWDAAIKSLELLTHDFGDTLIEVEPGRFLIVRLAVAATVAQLPAPGLAAYRRRVDPPMKLLFTEAEGRQSRTLMRQVVRDGFASTYGDAALDWLAEDALETGDLDAARKWWTALHPPPAGAEPTPLLRYPDADLAPAEVCARLVLCSLLQGDRVRATGEIAAFEARYGDVDGRLAGQSGGLAEMLSGLLADSRQWPPHDAASAVGDGVPRAGNHLDLSAVLWSQSLVHVDESDVPHPIAGNGATTTVPQFLPAIWNDVLVLPGSFAVRALSLADGAPRWPSGGAVDDGRIYADPPPTGDPHAALLLSDRNACRIVNGRCYVRTGPPLSVAASRAPALSPSRLVCLDLQAEGRLAWSAGSDEFADFPDGRFSGSPLVSEDRVYVPVRWAAPQVEVGLACLAAATGELRWQRRLCTAMETPPTTVHRIDHDALAAGAGLVFQLPAAGILAACDAETGELQWAATYPTSPVQPGSTRSADAPSALACYGGRVFAKPRDSKQLMAFHADDGRLLWSLDSPSRIRDLLGVVAGRLIASGDQLCGFEVATGRAWRFGFDDPEGYGFGRGAIAGERIYWPTHDDLLIVDAMSGQLLDRILFNPASRTTGGNLAIAGDRLIIAGPSTLTALGPSADH